MEGVGGLGIIFEKDGVVSLSGVFVGLSCCSGSFGFRVVGCFCGMWAASLFIFVFRGRVRLGFGGWVKYFYFFIFLN